MPCNDQIYRCKIADEYDGLIDEDIYTGNKDRISVRQAILTSNDKRDVGADFSSDFASVADTLVMTSVIVTRLSKPQCLITLIEVSKHREQHI